MKIHDGCYQVPNNVVKAKGASCLINNDKKMSSFRSSVPLKYPYFPPNQDPNQYSKDDYKNHPLLKYSLAKEKRKEVQKLV